MLRKCICLLWAICVVMGTGSRARAEERVGSIQILPEWCGTPVVGGTVSVSRVGERWENGFVLTDGLANWQVEESDFLSNDWLMWLAQKNTGNETVKTVEDETGAVFTDLEEGLYLVKQVRTDWQFSSFNPFFLIIPDGENWDIYRAPKVISQGESPRTGDHPAPIIGAMGIGLTVAVMMVLMDGRKK